MRFWRRGAPKDVQTGYTSDLSRSGAFVTTQKPVGRNGRIQMQLATGTGSYLLEGVVARSLQVPQELLKVKPGGMGIRFLRVEELVGELLEAGANDLRRTGEVQVPDVESRTVAPVQQSAGSKWLFDVDLSDRERFLRLWEQDIKLGGLFVESTAPAPAETPIQLRLKAPDTEEPLLAQARVVQVFVPRADSPSLLPGMGVVLVDSDDVLDRLGGLADQLRAGA